MSRSRAPLIVIALSFILAGSPWHWCIRGPLKAAWAPARSNEERPLVDGRLRGKAAAEFGFPKKRRSVSFACFAGCSALRVLAAS